TPPPSTISSGSTMVTTAHSTLATRAASSATTAAARSSPRAAAVNTRRAETWPRLPAPRAARTGRGGGRLQCPALAGVLGVGAVPAGHRQVGDLARDPVCTAEKLAADDQPHADAGADG